MRGEPDRTKDELIQELQSRVTELESLHAELQTTQESLQQERDFAESLIETAQALVVLLDPEGRIIRFNRYTEELTGYKLDELIGNEWFSIFLPKDQKKPVQKAFRDIVANGAYTPHSNPIVTKDGLQREIEWYNKALKDSNGALIGVLAVGRDITDRLEAEKEKNLLSRFPKENPNPVLRLAEDGEVLYSNNASSRIMSQLTNPNNNRVTEYWRGLVYDALKGDNVMTAELRVDSAWYFLTFAPLVDLKYVNVYAIEITEEKQYQRQLQQAIADLKRSNEDLGQFAYAASHDLQEPLRMVSSFVQLLQNKIQETLDDELEEYLHFITDGTSRMQYLIQDLLRYSRLGRATKSFAPVDCNIVVTEALDNLKLAIEESQANITITNSLPLVSGDKSMLVLLFQNLIGNAIKFRREQQPHVTVSALQINNSWEISIADNGIGIDLKFVDRIFMIFQRLHPISEYPGTGIGLALCKKIVSRHNGTISVASDRDKGSTFSFTLPVAEDQQAQK